MADMKHINWYPGHMKKTRELIQELLRRLLQQFLTTLKLPELFLDGLHEGVHSLLIGLRSTNPSNPTVSSSPRERQML